MCSCLHLCGANHQSQQVHAEQLSTKGLLAFSRDLARQTFLFTHLPKKLLNAPDASYDKLLQGCFWCSNFGQQAACKAEGSKPMDSTTSPGSDSQLEWFSMLEIEMARPACCTVSKVQMKSRARLSNRERVQVLMLGKQSRQSRSS